MDVKTGVADGIAAQEFLDRQARGSEKKPGKNTIRRSEDRESAVWGRVIDAVGRPPEGVKYIHVCDRADDDYEVFQRAKHHSCGFIIRASRLNRKVLPARHRRNEGEAVSDQQSARSVVRCRSSPPRGGPAHPGSVRRRLPRTLTGFHTTPDHAREGVQPLQGWSLRGLSQGALLRRDPGL